MNKSKKIQKTKSISEKIADIFTPAPLLDPEIDLTDETAAKVHDYSADEDDDVQEFNQQLSDIRKKNVPLLADVDHKYKGAVSSRKDLDFEDNDSDSDGENESDEEQQQYEDSESDDNDGETTGFSMRLKNFNSVDDNNDDNDDIEDDNFDENESIVSKDSGANVDDEDDNTSNDDDDDGDDESDFDGGDMFPDSNEDDDKSPTKSTTNETSSIIKPSTTTGDLQKGYAVQNQLKIWEKLLEMRIHTQKILTKANSMPISEKFQNLCTADQSFADLAQTTSANVTNLLEKMCEMQQLLVKQYPDTKQLAVKRKSSTAINDDDELPSKCERISNDLQKSFEQYTDYRDATITKWHDRTKVLTPGLKSSKTNPFNVVQSIRGILANRQELIRKTQQHKGGYELFDQQAATADECPAATSSKNTEGLPTSSSNTADNETPTQSQEKTELYCTEIYDDTDFYHTQLRELIEFKANTSNNMGDMTKQFIELQKLRNKIKKVVDTRASKGRKIRYAVHNKMVNFMAQNNDDTNWTDEAKDELFSSLFGAKTQLNVIG